MLVHVGDDRSVKIDIGLATFLAAAAGAINAAGFHAMGFFSANMTGNVSSLSDFAALGQWTLASLLAGLLAAYIVGAFCSALLIEVGRRRNVHGIYAYSIISEGVLLAVLGTADLLLPGIHSGPILIVGLSFLMGLQNATTTRISNARVRTTHVSGMATDIGVELAVLLGGARDNDDRGVVRSRFALHLSTLGAFLVGGIVGVLAYIAMGSVLLLIIAAALLAVSVPEARRAQKLSRKTMF
ncbi:transmembrane protein [Devosia geojensis]|uniref:Transmembrane protein n=1 Tax=Devosia geojensis TaxID=443610 RepID=A0A0F5FU00_9HYPH|nr:YoaK family protein [Devosia geojensis]KKB12354.1 transmembrane protein [Devosia geojensis]